MKTVLFALLVLSITFCFGCSFLPGSSTDCGYSGYFVKPKDGGDLQLRFSRVLAETLNGQTNCGFAYVPTRVQEASMNGKQLKEIELAGERFTHAYAAPPVFDPGTDFFTVEIKVGNAKYKLDGSSVKRVDDTVYFTLR